MENEDEGRQDVERITIMIVQCKEFIDPKLMLEQIHSSKVKGYSVKNRRGTKLEINYQVKRNNVDEEQKFLRTEIIDNKLAKQIEAERKQNHTFVTPKLNIITQSEIQTPIKKLRGNERAARFQFMQQLVKSNMTNENTKWKENDALDRFFNKKKKKQFHGIDLNQYYEHLEEKSKTLVSEPIISEKTSLLTLADLKENVTTVMSSINELFMARNQLCDTAKLMADPIVQRVWELEAANKLLVAENELLKEQLKQFENRQNDKVKQIIIGDEQSELPKFEEAPQKPKIIKVTDSKKVKKEKLKKLLTFDDSKLIAHKKEVLSSVVTTTTFADKLKKIGVPKQKIRYTVTEQADKIIVLPKPQGIPFRVWKTWCKFNTKEQLVLKTEKFLYGQFKNELYSLRTKWSKNSKGFNPYLGNPKDLWEVAREENPENQFVFVQKWRELVIKYKNNTTKEGWTKTK
jgi:hypothetical protein